MNVTGAVSGISLSELLLFKGCQGSIDRLYYKVKLQDYVLCLCLLSINILRSMCFLILLVKG